MYNFRKSGFLWRWKFSTKIFFEIALYESMIAEHHAKKGKGKFFHIRAWYIVIRAYVFTRVPGVCNIKLYVQHLLIENMVRGFLYYFIAWNYKKFNSPNIFHRSNVCFSNYIFALTFWLLNYRTPPHWMIRFMYLGMTKEKKKSNKNLISMITAYNLFLEHNNKNGFLWIL